MSQNSKVDVFRAAIQTGILLLSALLPGDERYAADWR